MVLTALRGAQLAAGPPLHQRLLHVPPPAAGFPEGPSAPEKLKTWCCGCWFLRRISIFFPSFICKFEIEKIEKLGISKGEEVRRAKKAGGQHLERKTQRNTLIPQKIVVSSCAQAEEKTCPMLAFHTNRISLPARGR